MMDAYGQLHGHSPACVTGKPVELGGSLGRESAAGRGVAYVSDVNANGRDIPALAAHQDMWGTIKGFPADEYITSNELFELDCDVLVPAAIDNGITEDNANRIKASMMLEATNHHITPEADDILNDAGKIVLPDILVNVDGVIVAYFEWTRNIQEFHSDEPKVNKELKKTILQAYR